MNSKKDYVFVYVCALLVRFICPCLSASLTCLIYRNLATSTPRSLYTSNLNIQMTQWLTKLSFSLSLSLFQVANLACSISNNEEGVKLVRMAATQIDSLCPQVKGLNPFYPPSVQFIPLEAALYGGDK